MEINKILQKIFKKTFQNLFKIFHGKIQLINSYDDLSIIKHKIDYLNIDKKNFEVKKNIYEINNAKIYTDLVEQVAVIKDKKLISEASFQQIDGEFKKAEQNKVLTEGTPRFIKKLNGSDISLIQGVSGENYFHFLFDIISKLKLFSQIVDLEKINYFYIQGFFPWQIEILKLFNIPENKIIDCKKFRHLKVDKLYVCEHPWYYTGYVQYEIKNIPKWIIKFLRTKFLNLSKEFKCSKKIFIDRTDSLFSHCKLINNDEIKRFLSEEGFEIYQTSKLKFLEQVYLFKNAEIIVSPHGAALSNIVFSNSNLKLIELIPENHPSKKCERISNILGFNYIRVELENLNSKHNLNGDMKISTEDLNKILRK